VDIDPNGGKKRNGRWRWWYSQPNPHMGYRSADVGAQTRRSYFSFSELRACWESTGNKLKPRVYEVRHPSLTPVAVIAAVLVLLTFRRW